MATKKNEPAEPSSTAMYKWGVAVPIAELDKLKKTADLLDKTPASLVRELIKAFNQGQIKLPTNPHSKKVYK